MVCSAWPLAERRMLGEMSRNIFKCLPLAPHCHTTPYLDPERTGRKLIACVPQSWVMRGQWNLGCQPSQERGAQVCKMVESDKRHAADHYDEGCLVLSSTSLPASALEHRSPRHPLPHSSPGTAKLALAGGGLWIFSKLLDTVPGTFHEVAV
jgi:hypothetical protein